MICNYKYFLHFSYFARTKSLTAMRISIWVILAILAVCHSAGADYNVVVDKIEKFSTQLLESSAFGATSSACEVYKILKDIRTETNAISMPMACHPDCKVWGPGPGSGCPVRTYPKCRMLYFWYGIKAIREKLEDNW